LWVDTKNQQLYVYSGSNWLLIGPQFSSGLKTGPDVETLTDIANVDHNVVTLYSENNRIAIVSKSAFTPKTSILGFANINQGITLSTVDATSSTTPTKFWGTASAADALNVNGSKILATNFLRSDQASTTNFPVYILNNGGLSVGTDRSFTISTDTNATILYNKTPGSYLEVKMTTVSSEPVTAIHIDPNGYIGIGPNNANPQSALDVAGTITADGNLNILGTTDATVLGIGSISTNGGLSVTKQSQFGGDVSINGGIHFHNLDLNGDPTAGTVIQPSSDDATELYDIGSDARKFRNIYAQNFVGNFNGAFTGSLSGNINGSAVKLASPTRFRVRGDLSSIDDVVFDGQLPQTTDYALNGYQILKVTATADIIDQRTPATDSFGSDKLLISRAGGLKSITKQAFIANIPTVPIGSFFPFAGPTAPSGYLFCDGSELPIGDYPDLFSVIGYSYKPPSELIGKSTFGLPDIRGRFALGRDNMDNDNTVPDKVDPRIQVPAGGGSANRVTDIVADTLGAGTGNPGNTREYITLDIDNLPDHKHNLNSGNAQYYAAGLPGAGSDTAADPGLGMPSSSTGSGLRNSGNMISTLTGQPFNSMNPYLTTNYIIFTGVI
jgi:microcystin-dependent protein